MEISTRIVRNWIKFNTVSRLNRYDLEEDYRRYFFGSVLGPISFNTFINELSTKSSSVLMKFNGDKNWESSVQRRIITLYKGLIQVNRNGMDFHSRNCKAMQ